MATGAHLCYPSVRATWKQPDPSAWGGQWDSVLAPGSFLGHSAGPQRKRNNSVQLWGSVREKEEMDIMTCMENTRKAFISTTANKCWNSL